MLSTETAEERAAGDGEPARVSPQNDDSDDAKDGDSDGDAGERRETMAGGGFSAVKYHTQLEKM